MKVVFHLLCLFCCNRVLYFCKFRGYLRINYSFNALLCLVSELSKLKVAFH
jgi:hypothetical protein